ncbi:beta-ketoacyl-ACP synthase III [Halarsenatibacter silvermanii]|uniref:Beta-ketoacyl-[acyl-carrier-protein] synthase III n=1 Tax=Halarsenatibacter silvermanii TaxID=321763 RepID=A0A1G9NTE8_9FIRM|nr:beta-ketoacyl-ACP synthase III [Halarsenatibacter silvermanii]SDL89660.1 3-oxoacyl-[acyl-carrier-protein] synthase III [Halarsenatibacter silvermanii]
MSSSSIITGLGKKVPDNVMTNKDLEEIVDTTDEWITQRTGIKERRIADEDTSSSDLAYEASLEALEEADLSPEDLEMIILATATPDMLFPATACLLQERLGADNAGAFDLEAGCSGFVYGLGVADQFIRAGNYENILVVGAETLSKLVDWDDRSTCVLFGDGAGAAVVQPSSEAGILSTVMGSDGSGGDSLCVPAGGSLHPASQKTVENKLHYIKMEGNQVFKFAVKKMGAASVEVLDKAGYTPADVDFFVPHQANTRIIDAAAKRLDLDMDSVIVNLPLYGNTSSASVPIALKEAVEENRIKPGDLIVLVAFGAGLTWASAAVRWK